jgi:hypothetical protein
MGLFSRFLILALQSTAEGGAMLGRGHEIVGRMRGAPLVVGRGSAEAREAGRCFASPRLHRVRDAQPSAHAPHTNSRLAISVRVGP